MACFGEGRLSKVATLRCVPVLLTYYPKLHLTLEDHSSNAHNQEGGAVDAKLAKGEIFLLWVCHVLDCEMT